MARGDGGTDDPLEKIAKIIDEKINAAFGQRDQKAKEESDPWARIEGLIDRSVARQFDAFRQGFAEADDDPEDDKDTGRRPRVVKGAKGDEPKGFLGLGL